MEEQHDQTEVVNNKPQKKKSKKKRILLWVILGVLMLALIGAGIFTWYMLKRPDAFFAASGRVETVTKSPVTPAIDIDAYLPKTEPATTSIPMPVPQNTPTSDEKPNAEQRTGIVNVALFGIDAYETGGTTSGTMPHTDANLILAINFDTKEISMISIARDCLATAPGYSGFYKFNCIFNVGGGIKNPKEGLALSCRAAEEWLGGISIPYYYGVDFQALTDLVDMIGGIDFDVDITLTTLDGKKISPGRRHLDGKGVLAYMRMRRSADGLDSSRTARQRKMLVAIFKKLKQEGKLSMVPDLLKTMGDNVYTNTSLAQTVALANFANEIDVDKIRTYSIQGYMQYNYDWRYCFIDQQDRIDIIKTVYGIQAEPMRINSPVYEHFLHKSGFRAIQYINITKKLLAAVHETSDSSAWTEEQKTAYALCWQDYENLQAYFYLVDQWTQERYDPEIPLTEKEEQDRAGFYAALKELEAKVRESANALNKLFNRPYNPKWDRSISEWCGKNSDINEVYVDFG